MGPCVAKEEAPPATAEERSRGAPKGKVNQSAGKMSAAPDAGAKKACQGGGRKHWMSSKQFFGAAALLLLIVVGGATAAQRLDNSMIFAGTALVGITGFMLLLAIFYFERHWDSWVDGWIKHAFETVDIDKSGSIDRAELYAGVLLMYVEVNVWVTVYAPTRDDVMGLMKRIDADASGDLGYDEFKAILTILSEQILARAIMQLIFTVACPIAAGYVVVGLASVFHFGMSATGLGALLNKVTPEKLSELTDYVPESLPATVMSSVLFLALPTVFKYIDDRSRKKAEKASKKLK
eukprot:TRINITY_DN70927_c0_g1_i1.p1 TRINITY_DN70927_c0_g1~~TRINITY_DN70927_c0_g1_i1.p1  ORF type:complete len:331 (-),score=51.70 TRINITY_DN70927_c0_g1_i1:214-1092(-)